MNQPAARKDAPGDGTAVVNAFVRDGIGVVCIDHPPVNALSQAVRRGLLDAVVAFDEAPDVRAVLILGEGSAFIAGADIREFGRAPQPPLLATVCNRIEACVKPVVAVVQGVALGGGLEVAMSAHYRLALPKARFGLPESRLGLLPGAGGTQRAPRLMGALAAAELMLNGKPLSAEAAHEAGLVDACADADEPLAAGLAHAQGLLAAGQGVRRTRDRSVSSPAEALAALTALAERTRQKQPVLFAPARIIDCVRAAIELPFDEGLAQERAAFLACMDSPQRAALVHVFFAEREVQKMPWSGEVTPRPLEQLAVVGGGIMGAGITVAALDAGFRVVMLEQDAAAASRAEANVRRLYEAQVAKGRLPEVKLAEKLGRLQLATRFEAVAEADLVIEAVFEDMAVKQQVFRELDRVCKPGAVLATNTSYLDIPSIAGVTSRPQAVIGLHFFSPAHLMKLLEIVVTDTVLPEVVDTAFALARRMRKVPVRAGVCDGFIGNRIWAVYKEAADHLMEDGASPYQIDEAMRGFGFAMGPYQVIDLAGGDIGWATRKRRAPMRDPAARYVAIADHLCERGWFGQKTGRGFYRYEPGARSGLPDDEVLAIVAEARASKGLGARTFTAADIVRRIMVAIVNEGAKVVGEGIALRPLDVDVTLIFGYGFPRWQGGPMWWADSQGLAAVLADIERFAKDDPHFWQPAPLLVRLVAEGKAFGSLNRGENGSVHGMGEGERP
ncbi:MAG: 3-hydroxyacyl-CoA dehydrogenase NAD-binding domain-containing protein [Lautropia sp.]|nr:3-hydroxyacyl-CoA dehydrogenase NAD-binding domain-containing protein [Lautropia sp.]